VKIIRQLGFDPVRPGATGYSAITAEARGRGLHLEERAISVWQSQMTPRQALESIRQREWSRTWGAPDDLFAESVHKLAAWLETRYASELDTPQQGMHSFKVARIAKPSLNHT
jgi:hypothetical protein